jgi:hypothetical protein
MAWFGFENGARRKTAVGLFVILVLAGGVFVFSQGSAVAQMMGHAVAGPHMHGADGTGHDELNIPGLRGENASPEESAELAVMFRNFETITRKVTNLPNGIRTVTRSSDEVVMANLVSHVTGMIGRVASLDEPDICIPSPTLDIFFERDNGIDSEIEITDEGVVVVQTTSDPEVVAALQIHVAEVSDMADRGVCRRSTK